MPVLHPERNSDLQDICFHAQTIQFGAASGAHLDDQVVVQIGGFACGSGAPADRTA